MFVAACAKDGQSPTGDSFCVTEQQRILSESEVQTLPIGELRSILARNDYGAKRCGWKGTGRNAGTTYWGKLSAGVGSVLN